MPSTEDLARRALALSADAFTELESYASGVSQLEIDQAFEYLHHLRESDDADDPGTWQKHAALQLLVGVSVVRGNAAQEPLDPEG